MWKFWRLRGGRKRREEEEEGMKEVAELLFIFKEAVRQALVDEELLLNAVEVAVIQVLKEEVVGNVLEEIVKRGLKDVLGEDDGDVGDEIGNCSEGGKEGGSGSSCCECAGCRGGCDGNVGCEGGCQTRDGDLSEGPSAGC